jgi:hypothetical protein
VRSGDWRAGTISHSRGAFAAATAAARARAAARSMPGASATSAGSTGGAISHSALRHLPSAAAGVIQRPSASSPRLADQSGDAPAGASTRK